MTFIPASTELLIAMKTQNANKVEEVILDSDSKKDLILEYISINGNKTLIELLPQFKSKGLVLNIKNFLNLE